MSLSSSPCCPPTAHPFLPESANYKPKGKIIQIKEGVDAYVTGQTTSGKAIVIAYEVFGIESGRLREICDYFSDYGYYVILADYQRKNYVKDFSKFQTWLTENHKWTDDQVKGVADAVVNHLKENGIKSVGVIGFCWGTWMALKFAQTYPDLCKAWGGPHPTHPSILAIMGEDSKEALSSVSKIPCIILTAGDDKPEALPGKENQIYHNNSNDVFYQYPDMKHGWVSRGDLNDEKISHDFNDAITKLLAFYQKYV